MSKSALPVFVTLVLTATAVAQSGIPPAGFKIAFIGDQGANANSVAVLELIAAEGADAVVHAADHRPARRAGGTVGLTDYSVVLTTLGSYP